MSEKFDEFKEFLDRRDFSFSQGVSESVTRRDEIALAAMQAIVSACGYQGRVDYNPWEVSRNAYELADAMLEVKDKT